MQLSAGWRLLDSSGEATQCRIFPFWPELLESRQEWRKTARYCPGMGKGPLIQIAAAKEQAAEMRAGYPEMY